MRIPKLKTLFVKMGYGKYNQEERRIAAEIRASQVSKRHAFKRWHFYDMKENYWIKKLDGKYKKRK